MYRVQYVSAPFISNTNMRLPNLETNRMSPNHRVIWVNVVLTLSCQRDLHFIFLIPILFES